MDFGILKDKTIIFINNQIELLENLVKNVEKIDKSNYLLKEYFENNTNYDFKNSIETLKIILPIINRNKMKCVFLGKTSNGKSAVINTIIGENLLPSYKGCTTCCFISIGGSDENDGYFTDINKRMRDLKLLKDLTSELSSEKYQINSLINVYYPKSKCDLLKNDIEILDSPGIDFSKNNDKWIKEYCQDADLFLLVVDGCSTIHESEKNIFEKISEQISKPNMIVLVNKWDLVEKENFCIIEKLKNQHLKEISDFLVHHLKLYSSDEVHKRIYFISALNALNTNENEDFKNFISVFEKELNNNAINTKFKYNIQKCRNIAENILDYISAFSRFVQQSTDCNSNEMKMKLSVQCRNAIHKIFGDITQDSKRNIGLESVKIGDKIKKSIDNHTSIEVSVRILEENLAKIVIEIFENHMKKLDDQLKQIFIAHSCILMTMEQINWYFREFMKFQEIIEQYKSDVMSRFRNFSNDIKNIFQTQHDKDEIFLKLRQYFKVAPPVLLAAGTALMNINQKAGAVVNAVGAIAKAVDLAIPENDNEKKLSENINDELKECLNLHIEIVISQKHSQVTNYYDSIIERFVKEQNITNELVKIFNELRIKCENNISELPIDIDKNK